MTELLRTIVKTLTQLEWLWVLLVRVSVGAEFLIAGYGKLGDLDKFIKYFTELGIPLPGLQAPFVATLEFVGGAALIVGFATRLFAAPLAITMIVAILTATEVSSLGHFLYLSEWNLFLLLAWLVFHGAGSASIDARIPGASGEPTA